ncbi:MAG: VWA domain-containing protein [Kofleriaceae bacterium]
MIFQSGLQILHPAILALVLIAGIAYWWSARSAGRVVFSSLRALPAGGETWRTALAWLPDAMMALAFVMFVFALVGPRKGNNNSRVHGEGIGIVMAVDISGSMRAEDLADQKHPMTCRYDEATDPTRLGAVKRVFSKFVTGREDDAIGLVAFARYADTRSPLTLDHPNLIAAARQLDFAGEGEDGTAIGAGLELAVQRVLEFKTRSKVVVLLTDGDSNVHDIDEDTAIDDAVKNGVKVYTIGAGSREATPICIGGELQRVGLQFDDGLLKKIADKTHGQYFRAEDAKSLAKIYSDIDKLEKTKLDENRFTEYTHYYSLLVWAALALIVASSLLRGTVLRRLP